MRRLGRRTCVRHAHAGVIWKQCTCHAVVQVRIYLYARFLCWIRVSFYSYMNEFWDLFKQRFSNLQLVRQTYWFLIFIARANEPSKKNVILLWRYIEIFYILIRYFALQSILTKRTKRIGCHRRTFCIIICERPWSETFTRLFRTRICACVCVCVKSCRWHFPFSRSILAPYVPTAQADDASGSSGRAVFINVTTHLCIF